MSDEQKTVSDEQKTAEQEHEEAREQMRRFEELDELPTDLKEWPDGKAKNLTFAQGEDKPYGEGLTAKLGPELVRHEDGSVSIDGEKVDNPDDYKGERIESAIETVSAEPVQKDN